ncbi:hypothetical protein SMC26_22725 [Actinomadura fulvescens]|uniref:Uncharacterized protein n=1 Tax=Actinomadura fulvescens TaxID=46160 RepID=A0ABN3QNY4_9ACTN
MRRRPCVTNDKPTPLSERLYALDASLFGLRRILRETCPGEATAADALCGLWPIVPSVGRGALGFSRGVGAEVFSHALTLPGGAERAGNAITRAQEDAIAVLLTALAQRNGR